MYATDVRQTDVRQHHRLMLPRWGHNKLLIFNLLTLTVVSESRVTWATTVLILVFLGVSVLDLGPMYATDVRQTDRRQTRIID